MKKTVVIIIVLLSIKSFSQDTIHFEKVDDFRRMYFEFGIQKPQKELSDKYEKSFDAGMWFRNKVKKNQYIDAGIEFDFLENPREINYGHKDSIVKFESNRLGMKIGLRYSRGFPITGNPSLFSVESSTGAGWATLFYTIPEKYDGTTLYDDLDVKTNTNTYFVSQTVKLNVNDFGIFCTYTYAPYSCFRKNMEANFGSQSIALGVAYRL